MFKLLRRPSRQFITISKFSTTTFNTAAKRYRRFGDPVLPPAPSTNGKSIAIESIDPFSNFKNNRHFLKLKRNPPWLLIVIGSGGIIYYCTRLERVEMSEFKRLRFMDTSLESETMIGQQALQATLQQYKGKILSPNDRRTLFVKAIAEKLIQANNLRKDGTQYNVYVIEDPTINAFVLPGGSIFVFTGILPIAKDADGLAIVLSHEIAHNVARHASERLSAFKVITALGLLLSTTVGIDFGISRMLLNFCLTLPNSRTAEMEADYIGLKLTTKACYNPTASVGLWTRMKATEGAGAGPEFLSTHPSSSNRIQKVGVWSEKMLKTRPMQCSELEREMSGFWRSR